MEGASWEVTQFRAQKCWILALFSAFFSIHVCTKRWNLFHCKTQIFAFLWFCSPSQFPLFYFCPRCKLIFSFFPLSRAATKRVSASLCLPSKLGHGREGGDGGAAGLQQTPPPQHSAQGCGSPFLGSGAAQWRTVLPVLRVCGCHVRLHKQLLRVLCGAGSQQWRGGVSEAAQWDHCWFWWSKSKNVWVNKVNWIHEFSWALLSSWRRVVY